MTHSEALTLPPCAECGGPTAFRTVALVLKCDHCGEFRHVEPEGTVAKPEPLRFNLAGLILRALGDRS